MINRYMSSTLKKTNIRAYGVDPDTEKTEVEVDGEADDNDFIINF